MESFGIARISDGEDVSKEARARFDRVNRENAKMRRILDRVQELVEEAWSRGERARVVVESIPRQDQPLSIDAVPVVDGPGGANAKPLDPGDGMDGDGEWVRIRNGINMDTCSAANIMPKTWLPQFKTEPGKSRQRYVGATGKIVNNEGQKKIDFMTSEGQGRSMIFQMADVSKILACVAMVCDGSTQGSNIVIFKKNGGLVVPENDVKIVIKPGSPVTNIRRKGNTYGMDAWVKRQRAVQQRGDPMQIDNTSGFTRPEPQP